MDRGFLDVETVKDLIGGLGKRRLVTIDEDAKVSDALELMKKYDIEQIPTMKDGAITGAVTQNGLFKKLIENSDVKDYNIADVKESTLPMVEMNTPVERLSSYMTKETGAILTKDESGEHHILTKYDVLNAFSK